MVCAKANRPKGPIPRAAGRDGQLHVGNRFVWAVVRGESAHGAVLLAAELKARRRHPRRKGHLGPEDERAVSRGVGVVRSGADERELAVREQDVCVRRIWLVGDQA